MQSRLALVTSIFFTILHARAMKAMKSMKKKAMKKTAKSYKTSRGALTAVFKGTITKSKGGLTKDKLMKTKSGKVRISPRVRVFRWLALW